MNPWQTQPVIFPVNYVLDGDVVVFRSDPGTKLDGATLARVAFEIDHVDRDLKSGWSVVVQGLGRTTDPPVQPRDAAVGAWWTTAGHGRWAALDTDHLRGRRTLPIGRGGD